MKNFGEIEKVNDIDSFLRKNSVEFPPTTEEGSFGSGGGGDDGDSPSNSCHKFKDFEMDLEMTVEVGGDLSVNINGYELISGECKPFADWLCHKTKIKLKPGEEDIQTAIMLDNVLVTPPSLECSSCSKKDGDLNNQPMSEVFEHLSDEMLEAFRDFMDGYCKIEKYTLTGPIFEPPKYRSMRIYLKKFCYKRKNDWQCGKYKGDECREPKKYQKFGEGGSSGGEPPGGGGPWWEDTIDQFIDMINGNTVPKLALCAAWGVAKKCIFEDNGEGDPKPGIADKIYECMKDILPDGGIVDIFDEFFSWVGSGFDADAYMEKVMTDIADCICKE